MRADSKDSKGTRFNESIPGNAEYSKRAHSKDDVDFNDRAHHHTLGLGPGQAAPGRVLKQLMDNVASRENGPSQAEFDALVTEFDTLRDAYNDFIFEVTSRVQALEDSAATLNIVANDHEDRIQLLESQVTELGGA